jgi:hypothetical protein
MARDLLAAALRAGAETPIDKAAVELLVGYNDGDLLDNTDLRENIVHHVAAGSACARWRRVYADVSDGVYTDLGDVAEGVLLLACSIAKPLAHPRLHSLLSQADPANALVVLRALSIALGVRSSDVAAIYRENQTAKTRATRLLQALVVDVVRQDTSATIDGVIARLIHRYSITDATEAEVYAALAAAVDRGQLVEIPAPAPLSTTWRPVTFEDYAGEAPAGYAALDAVTAAAAGPAYALRWEGLAPALSPGEAPAEWTRVEPGHVNADPPADALVFADHVAGIMRDVQRATVAQIIARIRERHGYETNRIAVIAALGAIAADHTGRFGGHTELPEVHGPYRWVASS